MSPMVFYHRTCTFSGAGEEAVYAEYYLAILEGIRNMAQEHIARVLNQPEPTFEKDEL